MHSEVDWWKKIVNLQIQIYVRYKCEGAEKSSFTSPKLVVSKYGFNRCGCCCWAAGGKLYGFASNWKPFWRVFVCPKFENCPLLCNGDDVTPNGRGEISKGFGARVVCNRVKHFHYLLFNYIQVAFTRKMFFFFIFACHKWYLNFLLKYFVIRSKIIFK